MASNYRVEFEENKDICTKANNKQKGEAREIIEGDQLPTFIVSNKKNGTLVKKPLVRLDLQEQFKDKNGIRYSNLQIQLNNQNLDTQGEAEKEKVKEDEGAFDKKKKKSTTIALVLMPCSEEIPENIMREAFNGSLDNSEKATILKTG
jgi:hypothetical protein